MTYEHFIKNNFDENSYFLGLFQNVKYFITIEQMLKNDFTLKTPLNSKNQNIKDYILSTKNSCFLHIRRGDYLNNPLFIDLCQTNYYNKSLKIIKNKIEKPHIFIFSNAIQWCKDHFLETLHPEITNAVVFEFIESNDEGDAVEEMELMRSCQNAIIANSTFSWWAAFLLDNKNKIVIMPKKFFTKKIEEVDIENLIVKDWMALDFLNNMQIPNSL
ncbi:alpha-1,2-fucosyltransferase [Helicobacter sp.]|uniref:alpha-1,2-fucosyltransferase n=1 Tax=Helicobacter sp. TaxID=218 RepID=UPI0025C05770|nr:alpha-1,2-fucosyltransferase [Helicobacter sp.]MCI5968138.1 alpha-1,2-fucosyltransferase [Helicobacter sp.]